MYFDQLGKVRACCQNTGVVLGDVTRQSLREIWESADAEFLRSSLERDDYSAGCEFCEWQLREGNEAIVFARGFDRFRPVERRPVWPAKMEFALTNTCNLQCVMCNGDWSSTIRSKREGREPLPTVYGDAFFEELEEFLPHLREVSFLGGEPFLGDEPLRVMEMLGELDVPPRVVVTTNGTIRTRRVERIVDALNPYIVVSIDGASSSTYDSTRVGAHFDDVIANLDWFIERLGPGRVSIAHCLMTVNWKEYADLLQLAERRGIAFGVNVVRFPRKLSLYHLGVDELEEVVNTLQSTDPGPLTAHRREMWDGHVGALARRLDVIRIQPPEWLPFPSLGHGAGETSTVNVADAALVFTVDLAGAVSVVHWSPRVSLPFTRSELEIAGIAFFREYFEATFSEAVWYSMPTPENGGRVLGGGRGSGLDGRLEGAARRDGSGHLVGATYALQIDAHDLGRDPASRRDGATGSAR